MLKGEAPLGERLGAEIGGLSGEELIEVRQHPFHYRVLSPQRALESQVASEGGTYQGTERRLHDATPHRAAADVHGQIQCDVAQVLNGQPEIHTRTFERAMAPRGRQWFSGRCPTVRGTRHTNAAGNGRPGMESPARCGSTRLGRPP